MLKLKTDGREVRSQKSKFKGWIVFGLVVVISAPACAQGQLDSLIAVALKYNPEIQMTRYQSMAAQAKIAPAGQLPDPQLKVGVMNFPTDLNITSQSMTMAPDFSLMEMFPWFGKLNAAADVQKYGYESSAD